MQDMQFKDGDLVITNDIQFVSNKTELVQAITLLLSTFKGEFSPEPYIGTSYTNAFKKYTAENMQGLTLDIQSALEQEPRIKAVNNIALNYDAETRNLIVNMQLQTQLDETEDLEVNLNAI